MFQGFHTFNKKRKFESIGCEHTNAARMVAR